jgi:hypothetical protein
MTPKYKPVKAMKMYRIRPDLILGALAEEGAASDLVIESLEKLGNGNNGYAAAFSYKDAYNKFCAAAEVPSWYQSEFKSMLSEFQDVYVFETRKEAISYSNMVSRIVTYAAGQDMNRIPGECIKDARKRLGGHMRTDVYRTPAGKWRKEKIKTDYERAMKELTEESPRLDKAGADELQLNLF